MGTARKIAKKVGGYASKSVKSIYEHMDPINAVKEVVVEPIEDLTGVTAMEDANDLAKKQYEEQKAAALAEEKAATEEAYLAIEKDRRRRAAMQGRSSTILTGSLGDSGLTTTRKTLLGA